MEEDLVITAFRRAALGRQPAPGLIVHSDRGGQYGGKEFRKLPAKYNCRQSMRRADDRYDNRTGAPAFAESYRFGAPMVTAQGRTDRRRRAGGAGLF